MLLQSLVVKVPVGLSLQLVPSQAYFGGGGGGGGGLPHMPPQVGSVYFPAVQFPGMCLQEKPKQVYVPLNWGGLG